MKTTRSLRRDKLKVLSLLLIVGSTATAEDNELACMEPVRYLERFGVSRNSSTALNHVREQVCEGNDLRRGTDISAAASTITELVPKSFNLGLKDSESRVRSFCREYEQIDKHDDRTVTPVREIVAKAFDTVNQCLEASRGDVHFRHRLVGSSGTQGVTLSISIANTKYRFGGLYKTGNIKCYGRPPVPGARTIEYTKDTDFQITGAFQIQCQRKGDPSDRIVPEATVTIHVEKYAYTVALPSLSYPPPITSQELQSQIATLALETKRAGSTILYFGGCPEGWDKVGLLGGVPGAGLLVGPSGDEPVLGNPQANGVGGKFSMGSLGPSKIAKGKTLYSVWLHPFLCKLNQKE